MLIVNKLAHMEQPQGTEKGDEGSPASHEAKLLCHLLAKAGYFGQEEAISQQEV